MARQPISTDTRLAVLLKARRRCAICFGLKVIKQGQIAHLDGDSSNNQEVNLAFLCFNHHDQYDSTTSQSKNFTSEEVKHFREELHDVIRKAFGAEVFLGDANTGSSDDIPGHYIRGGENDSAELKVVRMADGRYHVSGIALWGTQREHGPNLGQLDFVAEIKGGTMEFTSPYPDGNVYRAKLYFHKDGISVSDENWVGIFGMNVQFSGEYARVT